METNLLEKPAYEFDGKFYCDMAWNRLNAKYKKELVPNMVYTSSNPIISLDVMDAVKCHEYDSLLGPQLFERQGVYETLLETYLSTASASLSTIGTLKQGLISPDTMYALVLVNHATSFSNLDPSEVGMPGVIKILLQVKVQMILNARHRVWCQMLKVSRESNIPVPFSTYINFAEKWEILIGDEHLLSSMSNTNKPIHPVLEVDFISNRSRIYSKIDQVLYELRLQERCYDDQSIRDALQGMDISDSQYDFQKGLDSPLDNTLDDTDSSISSDDLNPDSNEGFDLPESDFN